MMRRCSCLLVLSLVSLCASEDKVVRKLFMKEHWRIAGETIDIYEVNEGGEKGKIIYEGDSPVRWFMLTSKTYSLYKLNSPVEVTADSKTKKMVESSLLDVDGPVQKPKQRQAALHPHHHLARMMQATGSSGSGQDDETGKDEDGNSSQGSGQKEGEAESKSSATGGNSDGGEQSSGGGGGGARGRQRPRTLVATTTLRFTPFQFWRKSTWMDVFDITLSANGDGPKEEWVMEHFFEGLLQAGRWELYRAGEAQNKSRHLVVAGRYSEHTRQLCIPKDSSYNGRHSAAMSCKHMVMEMVPQHRLFTAGYEMRLFDTTGDGKPDIRADLALSVLFILNRRINERDRARRGGFRQLSASLQADSHATPTAVPAAAHVAGTSAAAQLMHKQPQREAGQGSIKQDQPPSLQSSASSSTHHSSSSRPRSLAAAAAAASAAAARAS